MLINDNTPQENEMANEFSNNLEAYVESGIFQYKMAEFILGECGTLDDIQIIANDIKNTTFPLNNLNESADDEGITAIGAALGITKYTAGKLVKEPRSAKVLFRALRDKLEEMESRRARARAEEGGFIATVIYTIKQAIAWLVKKFKDLRDTVVDAWNDREAGSSQAKRDYIWLMNKNVDYVANNSKWW